MSSTFENRLTRLERATGKIDNREISLLDVLLLVNAREAFEAGEITVEEYSEAEANVSQKRIGLFARELLAHARKRSEQQ
ncbi:MAG: hypothetical protein IH905_12585 [Proteobacteria bacterium]|nr:hypothetical protein [Pseudomonadota bacterium]